MKKIFLLVALAAFGFGITRSQAQTVVNPDYKKALQQYMVSSGSLGSFEQIITQVTAMLGGALTDTQKEEITRRGFETLVEMFTPVYEKEISLDDLNKMNEFYQTPAGQRIAAAQANMANHSMQVGQQWSMQLQQVIQEVMAQ